MPPKKDVFADLFQSANKSNQQNSNKVPMSSLNLGNLNLDNTKDPFDIFNSSGSKHSDSGLDLGLHGLDLNGGKSGFDYGAGNGARNGFGNGSKNGSGTGSGNVTNHSSGNGSYNLLDDDLFGLAPKSAAPSNNTANNTANANSLLDDDLFGLSSSSARSDVKSAANSHSMSLLDDDFTDAFEAKASDVSDFDFESSSGREFEKFRQQHASKNGLNQQPSRDASIQNQRSSRNNSNLIQRSSQNISKQPSRDRIIAELVDIGFSVNDANEALSIKGPNLQNCVNYIMSKNSGTSNEKSSGISIPSIPSDWKSLANKDWLNKGVSLFNQTKQTVLESIDHLVDGQKNQQNDDRPAWMRSADKYKDQATEKKYGGEDYGSDSENINQDEIFKFMQETREKDKERNKNRLQNIKQAVLDSGLNSGRSSPKVSENSTSRVSSPSSAARILRPNSVRSYSERSSSPYQTSMDSPKSSISKPEAPRTAPVKPVRKVTETSPEVDLLGISTPLVPSLNRDTSPLNQFDQTDYTSSKEKAGQAFKSGDYSTALELYLICLNKLSSNHELRVVINSNLAYVYKLVGQLKKALLSIEEGLALIDQNEILTSAEISGKSAKYWYTKLLICKAEVLEHSEKFEESLEHYNILIQQLGVVDRKITDGKRRVDKVVNPENYKPKVVNKPKVEVLKAKPKPRAEKKDDELDGLQKEKVDIRVQEWVDQKKDNLRSLLVELNDIIPAKINMSEKLRHLSGSDLTLPKQVKVNYMKVISSIHPDKLASQCKDDKISELLCKSVFIKLNQSWEQFKLQENV